MMNKKKQNGFALIQVLIIAMLLFSLMYSFTRLSQTKQHRIDQKNTGNVASVVINELMNNTINNNQCDDGNTHPLESCLEISAPMQDALKAMGIDTSTATVIVSDVRID